MPVFTKCSIDGGCHYHHYNCYCSIPVTEEMQNGQIYQEFRNAFHEFFHHYNGSSTQYNKIVVCCVLSQVCHVHAVLGAVKC